MDWAEFTFPQLFFLYNLAILATLAPLFCVCGIFDAVSGSSLFLSPPASAHEAQLSWLVMFTLNSPDASVSGCAHPHIYCSSCLQ